MNEGGGMGRVRRELGGGMQARSCRLLLACSYRDRDGGCSEMRSADFSPLSRTERGLEIP